MMTAREILDQLKPEQIRERLAEIDGERRALTTLLRAALRRQQAMPAVVARKDGAHHG